MTATQSQTNSDRPLRILRRQKVTDMTGYSKSELYRRIENGTFPEPHKLGPNSTGWFEHEIQDWLRANVTERGRIHRRGRPKQKKGA